MKIPELTTEQKVCCTSVSDGICTLKNINDLETARSCLKYEQEHMARGSMIKAIRAEIRRQEKRAGKNCGDYISVIEK